MDWYQRAWGRWASLGRVATVVVLSADVWDRFCQVIELVWGVPAGW